MKTTSSDLLIRQGLMKLAGDVPLAQRKRGTTRFAKVSAAEKKPGATKENSADPSSAAIARWTHSKLAVQTDRAFSLGERRGSQRLSAPRSTTCNP